jgi:hypothetical protein
MKMFIREKFRNTAVAMIGAVVLTTVSVGAAVGPATATGTASQVSTSAPDSARV